MSLTISHRSLFTQHTPIKRTTVSRKSVITKRLTKKVQRHQRHPHQIAKPMNAIMKRIIIWFLVTSVNHHQVRFKRNFIKNNNYSYQ